MTRFIASLALVAALLAIGASCYVNLNAAVAERVARLDAISDAR